MASTNQINKVVEFIAVLGDLDVYKRQIGTLPDTAEEDRWSL